MIGINQYKIFRPSSLSEIEMRVFRGEIKIQLRMDKAGISKIS